MAMYYRRSNSNNPLSDYGHAMFVIGNDDDKISHYGVNLYTYDGIGAVKISDLKELIISIWEQCQDNDFSDFDMFDDYYQSLSADDVYNSFNPDDIVDSADGWDCAFMVCWFWTFIAEPNNIMAITTTDGAIVFDADLITAI